jgi:hypothetical protein
VRRFIEQRYGIVGYNGLTAKASINLQKITLSTLDNSLVIIDEVHLTRTLSNATQQRHVAKRQVRSVRSAAAANRNKVVALWASCHQPPIRIRLSSQYPTWQTAEYVFKWPGALTAVEIADAERLHACPVVVPVGSPPQERL